MSVIQTTIQNGRIDVPAPADLSDGTRVLVDVMPLPAQSRADEIQFMTEQEQSDDPEAIEAWIAELNALPPLTMTPEEEADLVAWRNKVREFNLEAVRKQMEEGRA
ncbi:MAG: hypothetical protein HYX68_22120 [Planctomycetes bacterium]|nr:hypothetical protein [Planctomycetota bacterium]